MTKVRDYFTIDGDQELMMSEAVGSKRVIKYDDVRAHAEKRGEQEIMVDGHLVKVRGHSLPESAVGEILSEWRSSGVFQSPYTKGIRTDHLLALAQLGLNQAWTLGEIKKKLREIMSDADHTDMHTIKKRTVLITKWEKFEKKQQRGKDPKDVTQRILNNFRALQRLCRRGGVTPYGYKLQQIGCAIEIFTQVNEEVVIARGQKKSVRSVVKYIRLNTHTSVPNSGREHMKRVVSRENIPPVDFSAPTLGPQ